MSAPGYLCLRTAAWAVVISIAVPVAVMADVGLLVYPVNNVVFRYNPAEYEVVSAVEPHYDPAYGVSGQMLWNSQENRVAYEVYRAPELAGFDAAYDGRSEFYMTGNATSIRVDGFSEFPRQLNDIVIEFIPYPSNSMPDIYLDGERVVGLRHVAPRMVVSTPTGDGFFSDTITFKIRWVGAQFMGILAYADKNRNRVFDGIPHPGILMEDLTVSTESRTWGSIKSLYRAE